jgi:hypothetical protein
VTSEATTGPTFIDFLTIHKEDPRKALRLLGEIEAVERR